MLPSRRKHRRQATDARAGWLAGQKLNLRNGMHFICRG